MNDITLNDIKFCSVNNAGDVCCYFVAILNLLHSSKTLNILIKNNEEYLLSNFPSLFKFLIKYIKFGQDNSKIYSFINGLNKILEEQLPNFPHDGYGWIKMLNFYYLPVIFHLCEKDWQIFFKILFEMSIEPQLLGVSSGELKDFLTDGEALKIKPLLDKYYEKTEDVISEYNNFLIKINENFSYNVVMLEMYRSSNHAGHVVTMISVIENPEYINEFSIYILDRNHIKTFLNYFCGPSPYVNIDRIKFHYMDENGVLFNRLLKYFKSCEKYFIKNPLTYVDIKKKNENSAFGLEKRIYSLNIVNMDNLVKRFDKQKFVENRTAYNKQNLIMKKAEECFITKYIIYFLTGFIVLIVFVCLAIYYINNLRPQIKNMFF